VSKTLKEPLQYYTYNYASCIIRFWFPEQLVTEEIYQSFKLKRTKISCSVAGIRKSSQKSSSVVKVDRNKARHVAATRRECMFSRKSYNLVDINLNDYYFHFPFCQCTLRECNVIVKCWGWFLPWSYIFESPFLYRMWDFNLIF
jgi:hypothetical protein